MRGHQEKADTIHVGRKAVQRIKSRHQSAFQYGELARADMVPYQELVVPETAKAMVWCGDSLCVGFKKEYNLIDARYLSFLISHFAFQTYIPATFHVSFCRTGAIRELFPTGKNNCPLITALPNQQLLLARDSTFIPHTWFVCVCAPLQFDRVNSRH